MIEALLDRLANLPPAGVYLVIAALAALENVFPPVPADTAAALGAFLAARNPALNVWIVYATTVGSNVATAVGMFYVARRFGAALLRSRIGQRLLSDQGRAVVQHRYQAHHLWGIFVSRFLPVYRAVVPPFAGMVGVSAARALPAIAAASAVYYGLVVLIAHRVGVSWDVVRHALGDLGLVLAVTAVAATAAVVWLLQRRRGRTG